MCPSQESLREHQAIAHPAHGPPHGPLHFQQFQPFHQPKDEESSILDLDSQKINSAFQQQQQEEERRRQQQMGGQRGQHSVSALLNWVDSNAPASAPPPGHPGHPGPQMWQRNGMQPVSVANGPLGGTAPGPMGPGTGPGPGPNPTPSTQRTTVCKFLSTSTSRT